MHSTLPAVICLTLIAVFFLVVIPVLVVWSLVQFFTRKNSKDKSIDNMTIGFAKERYAKGEIARDEYKEILSRTAE